MTLNFTLKLMKDAKLFDGINNKDESEIDELWDRYLSSIKDTLENMVEYFDKFEPDINDPSRKEFIDKMTTMVDELSTYKSHNDRMDFIKSRTIYQDRLDYFDDLILNFRIYWKSKIMQDSEEILYDKNLNSIDKVYKIGRLYKREGLLNDTMSALWYAILEMKDDNIEKITTKELPDYFKTDEEE